MNKLLLTQMVNLYLLRFNYRQINAAAQLVFVSNDFCRYSKVIN